MIYVRICVHSHTHAILIVEAIDTSTGTVTVTATRSVAVSTSSNHHKLPASHGWDGDLNLSTHKKDSSLMLANLYRCMLREDEEETSLAFSLSTSLSVSLCTQVMFACKSCSVCHAPVSRRLGARLQVARLDRKHHLSSRTRMPAVFRYCPPARRRSRCCRRSSRHLPDIAAFGSYRRGPHLHCL